MNEVQVRGRSLTRGRYACGESTTPTSSSSIDMMEGSCHADPPKQPLAGDHNSCNNDPEVTSNSLCYLIARARQEANRCHPDGLHNTSTHNRLPTPPANQVLLKWSQVQQLVDDCNREAIAQVASKCLRIVESSPSSSSPRSCLKRSSSPSQTSESNKTRRLLTTTVPEDDLLLPIVSPVLQTQIRIPRGGYFARSRRLVSSDSSSIHSSSSSCCSDDDEEQITGQRMQMSESDALALQDNFSSILASDDENSLCSSEEELQLSSNNDGDDDDDSIAFSVDSVCMRKQQIDSSSHSNLSSSTSSSFRPMQWQEHDEVESLDQAMAMQNCFPSSEDDSVASPELSVE